MEAIKYVQLSSCVNPSFWNKLTEIKLNIDKLDEVEHHIWGYYLFLKNKNVTVPLLEVDSTSFNMKFSSQNLYLPLEGKLINKNTIESFKDCDKMDLINKEGQILFKNIQNGEALKKPSILNSFFVLSFADLKKYHYYYWFCFPVPKGISINIKKSFSLSEEFSESMIEKMYEDFKMLTDLQKPYFILEKNIDNIETHTLSSKLNKIAEADLNNFYFVFYNISDDSLLIGSQFRNYILLILNYCPCLKGKLQKFISFNITRKESKISCENAIIHEIELPLDIDEDIKSWVGWEKNERDKMGPRLANMKNTLDPKVLAENAVDLNLKLMKWRILPDINLEIVKDTKCLILGSGTLGCSVARSLLAWGVRNITFVDNSTVSFSNPVRQSLFTYQDSVEMKCKAMAAADNLKNIFPGVNSRGVNLTIPMPGHSVGESLIESTKNSVHELVKLIEDHDIIFLLMDSRESRWLPTMLGSFCDKLIINAALGFDSYLVMRHGSKTKTELDGAIESVGDHPEGYKIIQGDNLGCYFCNDVTAPGNSTKDRTLDQQCTVTRPGVSQIAGALAVELAVSILQHPKQASAPAFYKMSQETKDVDRDMENQCVLGLLPHSIRGFLSSFNHILPATLKYNQCVACSGAILEEYKNNGWEFLLKVFNSSKYLEDVTHLTELFQETDFGEVLEFSDEDFD